MAHQDHETRYVEKRTGGGAGWFIAGGLIVALIIGGLLYTNGYFTDDEDVSIELNVPGLPK
ncbi:hypothetical protein [Roseibium marinum]|uniref:Uncharacterized protein n=1 Tax=Roseibium marinum TaxID=281252 RepID=A0A2S3ULW4_9HYPH|nr:hypothetical protein [Roseibium marinum]POF28712.1 hypothetical protein CLV41_112127 [Roseibium marinum]